jgi:uncharacterized repeat protein (TIGR03803 family)
MHSNTRFRASLFGRSWNPANAIALSLLPLIFLFVDAKEAQGQTYRVIHTFTGQQDGGIPLAGLSMDTAGNLFGTTSVGGNGSGLVFAMKHVASGWVLIPIRTFTGGPDGNFPGGVAFGPDRNLYGTTGQGGKGNGTICSLHPPTSVCKAAICQWTESVLYRFTGQRDGGDPSGVVFDRAGNLYGTTSWSGDGASGTVFELSPTPGGWIDTVLYSFKGENGVSPESGVIFDGAGNLYGTTAYGGPYDCQYEHCGTVFQLTPSGSGWTEEVLYSFRGDNDGKFPIGGLVRDASGNLYGGTIAGGTGGSGTVYMLSPSNGSWAFSTLYSFSGFDGPTSALVMDAAGNLYGTTLYAGAYGFGNVFKLARSMNGWTYRSLYDFTGGADGGGARAGLLLDQFGNLYGTTMGGGMGTCNPNWAGCGVVFEITP